MKINWCEIIGHRWTPVFFKGFIKTKKIRVIGTYCERCKLGFDDLKDVFQESKNNPDIKWSANSYSEKYF